MTATPPTLRSRLLWAAVVALAVVLLIQGLGDSFYIENTDEAIATARTGGLLVLLGCLLLLACATWQGVRGRRLSAALVAVPVVLSGGSRLLMPETIFALLSLLVAVPAVVAGTVLGLLPRRTPAQASKSSTSDGLVGTD